MRCLWIALIAIGCASRSQPVTDGGERPDAGAAAVDAADDRPPTFTEDELALLRTLRYDDGPAPADPSNHVADDPGARAFGQRLFFDARFSGRLIDGDNDGLSGALGRMGETGKVSCAGCHVPADGFVDTRSPHQQASLAALWTKRRTPGLLEIAFVSLYNWDGRRDSLWTQAIGVIESEREFNSGRLFFAQQIFRNHRAEYEAIFGTMPAIDRDPYPQLGPEDAGCTSLGVGEYACRGRAGDGADYDHMDLEAQRVVTEITANATKAMAAYMRQLRCGEGSFDRWIEGEASALAPSAQRGAQLFVGRAHCIDCHSGPRLTDDRFHNVGLQPGTVSLVVTDTDDRGAIEGIAAAMEDPLNSRGPFSDGDRAALPTSVDAALEGAFRTPTLRCIAEHPSFMHTAQMSSLDVVVHFFDRGGDVTGYPGRSELAPLGLNAAERADLVAFIQSLEGPGPDPSLLRAPGE